VKTPPAGRSRGIVEAEVSEPSEVDPFVRECLQAGIGIDVVGAALGASCDLRRPSPGARARLLGATESGRLGRFAAAVGRLMDVAEHGARALLDGIDRATSWEPGPADGIALFHISGGPAVANAVTGFVRVRAGVEFPRHTHLGDEVVLVVQGGFRDGEDGSTAHVGDEVRRTAGTSHALTALDGPDLIYLAVIQDGVDIGGQVMRAGDPGA
jgi:quercetin dioxygenase-like cupin family protein